LAACACSSSARPASPGARVPVGAARCFVLLQRHQRERVGGDVARHQVGAGEHAAERVARREVALHGRGLAARGEAAGHKHRMAGDAAEDGQRQGQRLGRQVEAHHRFLQRRVVRRVRGRQTRTQHQRHHETPGQRQRAARCGRTCHWAEVTGGRDGEEAEENGKESATCERAPVKAQRD
jgi:hypothetical protein